MGEKKILDVLNHELVPKMEVLSEPQKKKILEELSLNEDQLPRMNHDDSAAVALGANPGDLIKIKRKDPTAKYDYYRIVV